jgi:peptide/nickel transport system substrate-binding protein
MGGAARALAAAAGLLLLLGGCEERETGPVSVTAIGSPPRLANPNLEPLDPGSAFLLQAVAQGLVRFDAAGEIEPALAQRWIVSDDGLRYTFRLARAEWPGGGRITAEQVAARLRAATSRASRNPLKPLLGAIAEIVAMTDEVLEISLHSPRPSFLQLLAQPEMAVIRAGEGSGPYRAAAAGEGILLLTLPRSREEEDEKEEAPPVELGTGTAALAAALFREGDTDLVIGGTAGDLPLARALRPAANALVFDPVAGLFGLSWGSIEGPLAEPAVRHAIAMAIDRPALVATFAVPGLQIRESLLPPGIEGLSPVAGPAWTAAPLPARREAAVATLAQATEGTLLRLRVALPDGLGYRLLFAHLRRDWAAVGVASERVAVGAPADLRLIDEVAPADLATWYLRHFTCDASRVCDPAADEMLAAARIAPTRANRRALIANADRILADAAVFIPLSPPVRWSLVAPRLNGFRPNRFGRHPAGELVRRTP